MFAWKNSILLPALLPTLLLAGAFASPAHLAAISVAVKPKDAAALAKSSAAVPAVPIAKSDVYGFWTSTFDVGLDIHFQIETFFGADGTYEGRAFIDDDGEIHKQHEYGTWTLKQDSIYTYTDLNRCRYEGETDDPPCTSAEGDPVTMDIANGVKTLNTPDGLEMGTWVAPGKQFTLPDLFKSSGVAAGRMARGGNGSRRLMVGLEGGRQVSGGVAPFRYDVSGRNLGSPRSPR